MEIFRRVFVLACLLAAVVLLTNLVPSVISVKPVNWEKELGHDKWSENDSKRMMNELTDSNLGDETVINADSKLKLQDYIQKKTEGNLKQVNSEQWKTFLDASIAVTQGYAPTPAWKARQGSEYSDEFLFLLAKESPFVENSISPKVGYPLYIQVMNSPEPNYLKIETRGRSDALRMAPSQLIYPYRAYAFLLLIIGVAVYAFLPWGKVPERGVYYWKFQGCVVPDIMALIMIALFTALPFFIVSTNTSEDTIFSEGWIIITACMWFLALIFSSMLPIAAWYARYRLDVTPDGLQEQTLFKQVFYRYEDIEQVGYKVVKPPRWLIITMWIVSLITMRGASSVYLASTYEDRVIDIIMRDGRKIQLFTKGLRGHLPLIGMLQIRGIPIDKRIYQTIGVESNDPRLFEGKPNVPSKGIVAFIFTVTAILAFAYGYKSTSLVRGELLSGVSGLASTARGKSIEKFNEKEPAVLTPEQLEAEERIVKEMGQINEKLKSLTVKIEKGTPEERKSAQLESEALMKELDRLEKEFENIQSGKTDSEKQKD